MRVHLNRALQVRTADRLRASVARDEVSGVRLIDQLSEADHRELCEVGGGRLAAVVIRLDTQASDEQASDEQRIMLREVARLIEQCVRRTDILGATAPDTLLVLAPGLEPLAGRSLADRLRATLAGCQVQVKNGSIEIRVTVGTAYRSSTSVRGWTARALAAEADSQSNKPLALVDSD